MTGEHRSAGWYQQDPGEWVNAALGAVPPPVPPVSEVLRQGRAIRMRRRLTAALAVTVAVAAVSGAAAYAAGLHGTAGQPPATGRVTPPLPGDRSTTPTTMPSASARPSSAGQDQPPSSPWLPAQFMPGYGQYQWVQRGQPRVMPFVEDAGSMCAEADRGLPEQIIDSYRSRSGASASMETTFLFTDGSAASQFYGMATSIATCERADRAAQLSMHLKVDARISSSSPFADGTIIVRSWTGYNSTNTESGAQTDVEYIVEVGQAVSVVDYTLQGLDRSPDAGAQLSLQQMAADDQAFESDGMITGTVTGSDGTAQPNMCVTAIPVGGGTPVSLSTMSGGQYQISGLPPGQYLVRFGTSQLCAGASASTTWWEDVASEASARPVQVQAGAATSGINGTLP